MDKTKVIFRKFKDGQILAIFPELPSDDFEWHCLSYMHIGQHGTCHLSGMVHITKPATKEEYQDLMQELESVGYTVEPVAKNCRAFNANRKKAIQII